MVLQHMDAVLPGHGTVELHMPGTDIPPWAGGCQLVNGPGSKPPALYIVFACDEVVAMHP